MIDLIQIAPGSVFHALSDRRDLVDKLIKKDADRATPDALIGMVFRNQLNVHGIFLDRQLVGFAVSGVGVYAKGRALVVHDTVTDPGIFQEHWERLFQLLEQTAKNMDCKWIDFHGRLGWMEWAKQSGYKARQIVFTKEV